MCSLIIVIDYVTQRDPTSMTITYKYKWILRIGIDAHCVELDVVMKWLPCCFSYKKIHDNNRHPSICKNPYATFKPGQLLKNSAKLCAEQSGQTPKFCRGFKHRFGSVLNKLAASSSRRFHSFCWRSCDCRPASSVVVVVAFIIPLDCRARLSSLMKEGGGGFDAIVAGDRTIEPPTGSNRHLEKRKGKMNK